MGAVKREKREAGPAVREKKRRGCIECKKSRFFFFSKACKESAVEPKAIAKGRTLAERRRRGHLDDGGVVIRGIYFGVPLYPAGIPAMWDARGSFNRPSASHPKQQQQHILLANTRYIEEKEKYICAKFN